MMQRLKLNVLHKLLLSIEVLLVFIVPAIYLITGLVFALVAAIRSISELEFEPASLILYLIVIGGILGLISVFLLLARALGDERVRPGPRIHWVFLIAGALALAPFSYRAITASMFWQFIWFLPYLVTGHLIVVNRQLLWFKRDVRQGLES
jgi:hypothetical protein